MTLGADMWKIYTQICIYTQTCTFHYIACIEVLMTLRVHIVLRDNLRKNIVFCVMFLLNEYLAVIPSRYAWHRRSLIVHNHNAALPSATFAESRNLRIRPAADGAARMRVMRRRMQRQIQRCGALVNFTFYITRDEWIKHSSSRDRIEWLFQIAYFTLVFSRCCILEKKTLVPLII